MRKEKKIANYRIETYRRALISTPLCQAGAGTFVTWGLLLTNYTLITNVTTTTVLHIGGHAVV
jgi:hypothetical protein